MGAKRELMTVDDVQGVWAIMPTPSKDNASDWRATNTVDLEETARAVEGLADAGVDGILSLGTLGECATLTPEEKKQFIGTAVEAAAGRIRFFAGTTGLSTRDTIEQTRTAFELGADGTMLGIPMWCQADVPTAVQYFKDVAEACPDGNICIYANENAFKFSFPPPFWAQVAQIPQVIMAKYATLAKVRIDQMISGNQIRFLPIDFDYYTAARIDPDFFSAFWTSGAVCGPELAIAYRDEVVRAKQTNDWSGAKELADGIMMATMPLIPKGDFAEFNKYNIGLEKAKMDEGGWMKAGPCRPPYTIIPPEYLEGAKAAGRAWSELNNKVKAGK